MTSDYYSSKSRLGCLHTFLFIVIAIFLIGGYLLYNNRYGSKVFEIREIGINIKLERRYPRIRAYFSKDHKFGNDYIEYTFSNLYAPYIYIHGGDSIYAIDTNEKYKIKNVCKDFKITKVDIKFTDADIKKYDHENPDDGHMQNTYKFIKDSFYVKNSKYDITIHDNAKCLIVKDNKQQIIFYYGSIKNLFH